MALHLTAAHTSIVWAPCDGGEWRTNGGTQPLWARNGQELFYESMGTLMRVPVKTGATCERGTPEKAFDASPYLVRPCGGQPGRMYDVSADERPLSARPHPLWQLQRDELARELTS